jgi:hypothetical protein
VAKHGFTLIIIFLNHFLPALLLVDANHLLLLQVWGWGV